MTQNEDDKELRLLLWIAFLTYGTLVLISLIVLAERIWGRP